MLRGLAPAGAGDGVWGHTRAHRSLCLFVFNRAPVIIIIRISNWSAVSQKPATEPGPRVTGKYFSAHWFATSVAER